jgi:hypothetical protein
MVGNWCKFDVMTYHYTHTNATPYTRMYECKFIYTHECKRLVSNHFFVRTLDNEVIIACSSFCVLCCFSKGAQLYNTSAVVKDRTHQESERNY